MKDKSLLIKYEIINKDETKKSQKVRLKSINEFMVRIKKGDKL